MTMSLSLYTPATRPRTQKTFVQVKSDKNGKQDLTLFRNIRYPVLSNP